MKRLIVLAMLATVACASAPRHSIGSWRKVDERAEPFETARAACKTVALKRSEGIPNQSLATQAAAGAFAECMRARGWALADVD